MGTFETPVHKIFRFPYDRSSGTSKSVIQIGSAIKIIGITKFGDRRVRQIIGNKRIIVPVGNQCLYNGGIHCKRRSMTNPPRKKDLIGHIFPCFTIVQRTNSSITMVTVFIKIDIKRITYKKRSWTFRPIFSCNRCRYFGRESFFYLLCTRHTQILFRRIGIFILDYHYQVFPLRVFHNSGINHTEIWIEEHLRL